DENPGEFYTKIWSKTISTPKEVQVSGTIDFRKALESLDAEDLTPYPNTLGASVDADDADFEEEQ
ncbi:hypothetical protein RZS08_12390, partial [Arthrospira platensis SPKY1]|nr:hypothetical protein [Arthrospira platensis SPKY1]